MLASTYNIGVSTSNRLVTGYGFELIEDCQFNGSGRYERRAFYLSCSYCQYVQQTNTAGKIPMTIKTGIRKNHGMDSCLSLLPGRIND
jgi:hypothetical protein